MGSEVARRPVEGPGSDSAAEVSDSLQRCLDSEREALANVATWDFL